MNSHIILEIVETCKNLDTQQLKFCARHKLKFLLVKWIQIILYSNKRLTFLLFELSNTSKFIG